MIGGGGGAGVSCMRIFASARFPRAASCCRPPLSSLPTAGHLLPAVPIHFFGFLPVNCTQPDQEHRASVRSVATECGGRRVRFDEPRDYTLCSSNNNAKRLGELTGPQLSFSTMRGKIIKPSFAKTKEKRKKKR